MKRLAHLSCFLFLVLLCTSVASSILLFDISVTSHNVFVSTFMLVVRLNRAIGKVVFSFMGVVIFLGFRRSSKQMTSGDIDGMFFVPHSPEYVDHEIMLVQEENKEGGDSDNDEDDECSGSDGYEEDNDDDMESEEDEDSEAEEGDGDLERRSEEFIAKMNSKWREELLHERLLCVV
ncbi:hypothetical protein ACJRO7_020181 [Eucalyptus globulus]|uniref:Uncharacterized protein n=1 Tax=Eucalyptus globulus TaxID=34317 RepID=A0ABD3KFV1_EUCGL